MDGWPSDLAPYVILVRAFVEGRLTATEFDNLYLATFKRDPIRRRYEVFRVLDLLFADIDAYHPKAKVRKQTEGSMRRNFAPALPRHMNNLRAVDESLGPPETGACCL